MNGADSGDSKERVLVLIVMLGRICAWTERAAVARRKERMPSQDGAMVMMRLLGEKGRMVVSERRERAIIC